ncbi:hypothetical protein L210DRAFT_3560365 [Boletus edulis BED1]|uniref:Uncharacterized protein n=1 Tax=Boletus edulis BED1 TaxID=1328754 RepID=A0AAD4G9I8_BOLED|nr:hypothetical protein L210DRAFT_3560365 [Boletus edulis BED1]
MTKRGVKDLSRRAINNPFASLGIIFGAFSVLLAITSAILLSRNHYPSGYLGFFRIDCVALGLILLPASLMVVGGDRHQRNAYKHVFSMSAIVTQLAIGTCLWCITCGLGYFTGHSRKLMQPKFAFACSSYIFVCSSVVSVGNLIDWLNNRGDPNFHHE